MSRDTEDGMGFAGLVPSKAEQRQDREYRELAMRRAYMRSLPFCADHRDKVKGKPCRECEIERLRLMLKAAKHLLLAATGPDDGPTSWTETRQRWMAEYEDE